MTHYNKLAIFHCFAGLAMFWTAQAVQAQEKEEQNFYTAPREIQEWICLGNSETVKWEYDKSTLSRIDSVHLRVRIRETPLKNSYYDIRRAKMWDQRSIQGYSDTLRLHPQFYFEGYERYAYTVLEESIDLNTRKYMILYAADYDYGGLLIALGDGVYDIERPVSNASPEYMAIAKYVQGITKPQ